MALSTLLFSTLCLSLVFTVFGAAEFDCRRTGQVCHNGGVCQSNKLCLCTDGVNTGYNCRVIIANVDASGASCSPSCLNGGVCVNDGTCVCQWDYYGSICQSKRVDIVCSDGKQLLHVNPEGFQGIAYISGVGNREKTDNCVFKPVADLIDPDKPVAWTEGIALVIADLDGNCGDATKADTGANEKTTERFANVEYMTNTVSSLDERVAAKCVFDTNGLRTLDPTITSVTITDADYTAVDTQKVYEPLRFAATAPGGSNAITTPMAIGEDLTFTFIIAAATGYDNLIIESLTATDGAAGGKTMPLISNKCKTVNAEFIVTLMGVADSAGGRTATIVLRVFKFTSTSNVEYLATATICKPGETGCETATCPPSKRRRRRRASGSEKKIQAKISVFDPMTGFTSTGDCSGNDSTNDSVDTCFQNKSIITVLATLGAGLLVFVIVCIVLIFRLFRKSPKMVEVSPFENQPPLVLPRLSRSNNY